MIILDEEALICDFAETYGIYDYRALRPTYAGVLACGLREDSRIRMKKEDWALSPRDTLLAIIADKLELQSCQYAYAHGKTDIEPRLIIATLKGNTETNGEIMVFESSDDFKMKWKEITENG